MRYTDIKKNSILKKVTILFVTGAMYFMTGCGNHNQQTMVNVENGESAQETLKTEDGDLETEVSKAGDKAGLETEVSKSEDKAGSETEVSKSEDKAGSETEVPEIEEENDSVAEKSETGKETDFEADNKKKTKRVKVKGIYVSGPIAGHSKMDELIELVDTTELNAMVIDVKNDDGRITYQLDQNTVASQIGANINYVSDMNALVKRCKEKNIYLIARIVAFKDPYLAQQCPDYAVKTKSGDIFHDKSGLAWVNPYNHEVWDYLIEVATQAANIGFDEIQFDYIRFSTDLKSDKLDFGPEAENKSKTDIITEFTQYAHNKLSDLGVYVAADVYGTIIDSKIDQDIVGQNYVEMASNLDYICPMVYPSHYANGVYGIPVPDAQPYDTVKAAMQAAAKQLNVIPEENRAINRVWIQSFTASWVDGHISYGPKQIRDQIHGAYDAGFDEWILWNAAVKYQKNSLLTEEEAEQERLQWEEEKPVQEETIEQTDTVQQEEEDVR